MVLSGGDSDKWATVVGYLNGSDLIGQAAEAVPATPEYEEVTSIRQEQRRLTAEEAVALAARYLGGETVYQLAEAFGCSRQTVSAVLKRNGVMTRGQKLDEATVGELVRLYRSGRSMAAVSEELGISTRSVLNYLQASGVQTRDSHGRPRT